MSFIRNSSRILKTEQLFRGKIVLDDLKIHKHTQNVCFPFLSVIQDNVPLYYFKTFLFIFLTDYICMYECNILVQGNVHMTAISMEICKNIFFLSNRDPQKVQSYGYLTRHLWCMIFSCRQHGKK